MLLKVDSFAECLKPFLFRPKGLLQLMWAGILYKIPCGLLGAGWGSRGNSSGGARPAGPLASLAGLPSERRRWLQVEVTAADSRFFRAVPSRSPAVPQSRSHAITQPRCQAATQSRSPTITQPHSHTVLPSTGQINL